MRSRAAQACLLGLGLGLTAACHRGNPPTLFEVDEQIAVVGEPLVVQIVASDPEGDTLTFGFSGPAVPDLATTASITTTPAGLGIFTFTPLASQIGLQILDLSVSDGRYEDHVPLFIDVRGASGSGTVPVFLRPLGAGTVLDLDESDCLQLDVEVDDPDSVEVMLDQAPPLIEGASLTAAADGRTGSWSWCPTRRQIDTADRYTLYLVADDGDNPAVTKEFVIVLRRPSGEDCPGVAPVIEHTPMDLTTRLDLPIVADISDDLGLGSTPYVAYAYEDPGDPIDFTKTTLVLMELEAGDMQDGSWRGVVTNTLANAPEGTTTPLFYLVSATDDDDADGDCDHRSDDPASGMHRITITAGGDETAAVCEPCSFDVQCGGPDDLCLPSPSGGARCGTACTSDDECGAAYVCSPQPVASVEGQSGRQCIPSAGTCGSSGGCEDDDHEPDGTPAQALAAAPLGPGTLGGRTLCNDDDDWYALELGQAAHVTASLEGDVPPDIDLSLTTAAGVLLELSDGLSSSELVEGSCLDPGTYLLRVYSVDSEPAGAYALELQLEDCGTPSAGDCCTANTTPGCDDPTIEGCVCGHDAYCCDTEWDGICVGRVGSDLCGPSCAPDDADGPCCTPNGTAGCEVNSVESCVCMADPFCCSSMWDDMCVTEIGTSGCGTCPA